MSGSEVAQRVVAATEAFTVRSEIDRPLYTPIGEDVQLHVLAESILEGVCRASGRLAADYTADEYLAACEEARATLDRAAA